MAIRPILTAPDPLLQRVSQPVDSVTNDIKILVADMFETMYHADGIGLAAAQIGVALRIAVTDVRESKDDPSQAQVYINPVILSASAETEPFREGCLSVPKAYADVVRPAVVHVKYLDLAGVEHIEELTGLQGVCLQHEMDHMQGILFIDHLPKLQRSLMLEKCEKLKRRK